MSALNHKLGRDLWRMKGQAAAIGAVIAVGVLMLVMMQGLVSTLSETRDAYYARYRLADVFAPAKRAPDRVLADLANIPGVASVQGRVNAGALIDLPGVALPLPAQAVSLPDYGAPALNNVYLTEGRQLDSGHGDEILLLEGFAKARNLHPGDTITATMNGARRSLRIVGLAQSPEFLFAAPPGEMMPDDSRFAVIWMSNSALAAAFDLTGSFNEALMSVSRDALMPQVLARADALLAPYGGLGAYARADQTSNRYITEEIGGLRASAVGVPPIFLGVAAFLLYIVVSRMVQAEREQIGLMMAFGYSSREVGLYYLKFTLLIAVGGALLGCLGGVMAGRGMAAYYQHYFKFPFIVFRVDPGSFILGFLISVASASVGGALVLRRVFALTPAVAMRAPAPADYSRAAGFGRRLKASLDQPTRMVIRNMTRAPGRALGGVIGIAAGMALSVAMLTVLAAFNTAIKQSYSVIDRSDASVSFDNPVSDSMLYNLQSIDGVLAVEPFRSVPVVLRNGRESYRGAIEGLIAQPQLYRAMAKDGRAIRLRSDGIILGTALAEKLGVKPGDSIKAEVRDGRRPVLNLPVAGVADTLLGSPSYLEIGALGRALGEPRQMSGAYLKIDTAKSAAIYVTLKKMPAVAGVSLKKDARAAFQKVMDQGAGAMRYIMVLITGVITFGIVYNSARIAFAERARDLASLRVLGLTRGETAFILLGELAVVTLIAIPVGAGLGYYLSFAMSAGFSSDLYRVPAMFSPPSYGTAALAILIASVLSGWLVKRDIDRLDLVSALKTRE
ncbi:ABC transporter permease [Thioclava sp.]|uniref:ABC transporter permease n=1 Tax=Thioclava sp. TaxID=1933450 RepID=UPI003AA9DAF1